jgi:hypothetical protein
MTGGACTQTTVDTRADCNSDKVYAVDDVNCQQSGFVEHGMCEVELFVESQVWAREEVDWAVCRDGATRGDIV